MTLCSVCKKNPAVVFVNKIVDGKPHMDGLCLACAKERGINPLASMMQQYGASEEDIENLNNQFNEIMDSMSEIEMPEEMLEGMENDSENPSSLASMMASMFGKKDEKSSSTSQKQNEKNKKPKHVLYIYCSVTWRKHTHTLTHTHARTQALSL